MIESKRSVIEIKRSVIDMKMVDTCLDQKQKFFFGCFRIFSDDNLTPEPLTWYSHTFSR